MKSRIFLSIFLILIVLANCKTKKKTNNNLEIVRDDEDKEEIKEEEEENELLTLDTTNYRKYIYAEKFFVLFHNPWCKYSQNLEKKIRNVNKLLKMEQQPFYIGAADCTVEDCKKIISDNISSEFLSSSISYPKFIYYEKGQPVDVYNGKHNKHDIYTYVKRKIYKDSIHLSIVPVYESKIIHDKKAFIYFGDFNSDKNSFELYNQIAKDQTDFMFYHTNDEAVYLRLNPQKEFSIIYYNFGRKIDQLNKKENLNSIDLNKFIKKNTFVNFYPKVTEDAINEIMIKKQSGLILFRSIYNNSTSFLEENFPLVAKSHPQLKFVITDLTGKYEMKLAKLLDVSDDLPTLRLVDFTPNLRKFELTRDITLENVLNFIKMWKENKLQPIQSKLTTTEIIPNKDSHIRKISLLNYYESVIFNRKNSVVFFYTNWCTHCIRLQIILETVAKRFNPNLISFYSVDVEETDKSQYTQDIDKVPFLNIYTIKDKEHPVRYFPDNFSVNAIYQYIAEKTFLKEAKSDL